MRNWLRGWVNRRKPRCAAEPPWRLADAAPCCLPRGHERDGMFADNNWHGDCRGYIWNDVLGRWQWNGPVVDLRDEYDAWATQPQGDLADGAPVRAYFTEWKSR